MRSLLRLLKMSFGCQSECADDRLEIRQVPDDPANWRRLIADEGGGGQNSICLCLLWVRQHINDANITVAAQSFIAKTSQVRNSFLRMKGSAGDVELEGVLFHAVRFPSTHGRAKEFVVVLRETHCTTIRSGAHVLSRASNQMSSRKRHLWCRVEVLVSVLNTKMAEASSPRPSDIWIPPAGLEPTLLAPEASALSTELWGHNQTKL